MRRRFWMMLGILSLFTVKNGWALFDLSVNPTSVNLGNMDPNTESVSPAIICSVSSDINMVWSLNLAATPLTHTDNTTTFLASKFRYWFTFDYPGTEVPAFTLDAPMPTSNTTIYTAGSGEFTPNPGTYGIQFKAVTDGTQKTGSYSAQIILTLLNAF